MCRVLKDGGRETEVGEPGLVSFPRPKILKNIEEGDKLMRGRTILIFAVLAALFVPAQTATAQGERVNRPQYGGGLERMSEELGLTDGQKEQLRQNGKEQAEARRAIRGDESLTAEQKREKLRQLNQERQAKMKEVLTPEQQEKFRGLRQQRRSSRQAGSRQSGPRGGDRGPGGGGFGGGGRMAEELGLSDEQREQFRAINEQQREQFEAIRNDESLSQEDRRAKMRELREARQAQMKEILTPEQQKKFEKMRQGQRRRSGGRRGGRRGGRQGGGRRGGGGGGRGGLGGPSGPQQ